MRAGKTRRNPTKKSNLLVVNEHFEEDFNAVLPGAVVFQQAANAGLWRSENRYLAEKQHGKGFGALRNALLPTVTFLAVHNVTTNDGHFDLYPEPIG